MHENLCRQTAEALHWLYCVVPRNLKHDTPLLQGFCLELVDDRYWRFNFFNKMLLNELISILILRRYYRADPTTRCLPLENYVNLADDRVGPDFLYSENECVVFMNSRLLLDMFEKHDWCSGMPDRRVMTKIKDVVFPPAYEPGLFQPPPPYKASDPRSKCTIL